MRYGCLLFALHMVWVCECFVFVYNPYVQLQFDSKISGLKSLWSNWIISTCIIFVLEFEPDEKVWWIK